MRRLLLILGLLAVVPAYLVAGAGASGSHTYQAELFNAFGLVKGSELRVAGAKAGTITDLGRHAAEDGARDVRGGLRLPGVQGGRELLLRAAVSDRRVLPRLPAGLLAAAAERADPRGPQQDHRPAGSGSEHPARAVQGPAPAPDQRVRYGARRQRREPQRRDPLRRTGSPAAQAGAEHPGSAEHDDRRAQHQRGRDLPAARESQGGRRPLHRQRRPHRRDLGRALERPGAELPPAGRLPRRAEADDVPARQPRRAADAAAHRPARRRARPQQAGD